MGLPGSLKGYSNFVTVWGFSRIYQCFRTGASLHQNYNKNGNWKYNFNEYELNVKIHQCFRTGPSLSIHNNLSSSCLSLKCHKNLQQTIFVVLLSRKLKYYGWYFMTWTMVNLVLDCTTKSNYFLCVRSIKMMFRENDTVPTNKMKYRWWLKASEICSEGGILVHSDTWWKAETKKSWIKVVIIPASSQGICFPLGL